ncbi:hypothetical protein CC80DRAFT_502550 [Byssothecium circinans]|uniref:Uncharacterized protein n=1 Tax=Byssothecium circinans TaxID=147558 RepID=A0A6A5U0C4_9PLEO|nr:hypothetical protein CC80DRAFT_502550 [Byssothecium circinans]
MLWHKVNPHPTVKLYILTPNPTSWTLTCTLKLPDIPPRIFELSNLDYAHRDVARDKNSSDLDDGNDASAVGMSVRVARNKGILKMEYKSDNGAEASWTFNGLVNVGVKGNYMSANMAVQTEVTPAAVMMTGTQTTVTSTAASTTGTQTAFTSTEASTRGTQTMVTSTAASTSGTQTTTNPPPSLLTKVVYPGIETIHTPAKTNGIITKAQKQAASATLTNIIYTGTETVPSQSKSPENPLKRRRSLSLYRPHKLARSKEDLKPFPRYFYMECYRNTPAFSGGLGVLRLDTQKGTVQFEGTLGRKYAPRYITCRIGMDNKQTKVAYTAYARWVRGIDHKLLISHLFKFNGESTPLMQLSRLSTEHAIWSTEYKGSEKIIYDDAEIFIDALVHIIDCQSGRETKLHDPEADQQYEIMEKRRKEIARKKNLRAYCYSCKRSYFVNDPCSGRKWCCPAPSKESQPIKEFSHADRTRYEQLKAKKDERDEARRTLRIYEPKDMGD